MVTTKSRSTYPCSPIQLAFNHLILLGVAFLGQFGISPCYRNDWLLGGCQLAMEPQTEGNVPGEKGAQFADRPLNGFLDCSMAYDSLSSLHIEDLGVPIRPAPLFGQPPVSESNVPEYAFGLILFPGDSALCLHTVPLLNSGNASGRQASDPGC
ncbi:hypothetical protein C8J57DRAFT_507998 [Mycena rebaudengoi]|nr:hypothetical protein C8J57DRAFT_507998 [Mycena rebaudengoi]